MDESPLLEKDLEPLPPLPKREKKAPSEATMAFGRGLYGDTFTEYHRIGELKDHIVAFKETYYQRKMTDPKVSTRQIIIEFNKLIAPAKFHPYRSQLAGWTKKWDRDMVEQIESGKSTAIATKDVYQVLKTRDIERAQGYVAPGDEELEGAVRTLGGELINDALQMLHDDQRLEDLYESDELMKRRAYVTNVFGHAYKMTQGKAALLLKASREKRDNAGFLLTLLSRATSGKMSEEELALLKTATPVVVHEHEPSNV